MQPGGGLAEVGPVLCMGSAVYPVEGVAGQLLYGGFLDGFLGVHLRYEPYFVVRGVVGPWFFLWWGSVICFWMRLSRAVVGYVELIM